MIWGYPHNLGNLRDAGSASDSALNVMQSHGAFVRSMVTHVASETAKNLIGVSFWAGST